MNEKCRCFFTHSVCLPHYHCLLLWPMANKHENRLCSDIELSNYLRPQNVHLIFFLSCKKSSHATDVSRIFFSIFDV